MFAISISKRRSVKSGIGNGGSHVGSVQPLHAQFMVQILWQLSYSNGRGSMLYRVANRPTAWARFRSMLRPPTYLLWRPCVRSHCAVS